MSDEPDTATTTASQLGFPLPSSNDTDLVTSLSMILVASIQEAKDRIAQIEYVFCSQLYPSFKSDTLTKRRRIELLERQAEQNLILHNNLVQSMESALRDAEEKRNAALKSVDDLDEKLRAKARQFDEEKGRLLVRVEKLTCELESERSKRNRVIQAYKRLKSQHLYLRRKFGLNEENVVCQNNLESGSELGVSPSPIVEHGLAFENPNMAMGACEAAEESSEIPELYFGGLEKKTPDVFVAAHDINEVREKASEAHDINEVREKASEAHDINEVREKASEDDRGANVSSSSGFCDVLKCPSSTKLVCVSNMKRPASSWRQTRSHQSRAGPDPHDDFLDTPLENIRGNLNKDLNKEDLLHVIEKDIIEDSSDDETQDMNAKSSPQKKHKQSSIADEETQDMNAKSSPQTKQKQTSITVANKRSFKYVEPVRKKAERENLKGVECKQCRKFYDAVLPTDGKDADSSKQNFRCEHLDGVSRHRYRYVPPMTPEGFWNIGFESEM